MTAAVPKTNTAFCSACSIVNLSVVRRDPSGCSSREMMQILQYPSRKCKCIVNLNSSVCVALKARSPQIHFTLVPPPSDNRQPAQVHHPPPRSPSVTIRTLAFDGLLIDGRCSHAGLKNESKLILKRKRKKPFFCSLSSPPPFLHPSSRHSLSLWHNSGVWLSLYKRRQAFFFFWSHT